MAHDIEADFEGLTVPEVRELADEYRRERDWTDLEALPEGTADEKGFKAAAWARKAVADGSLPERLPFLREAARDEDWRVRERVAQALKHVNEHAFPRVEPAWREWVDHEDNYVRRACEVGLMGVPPAHVDPALELFDALASDSDDYVKKSCGGFALSHVAATDPAVGREHVERWSRSEDLRTRWNAAKAVGGAYGRATDHALDVAHRLAGDDAYRVRRATAASLRDLFEKRPAYRERVEQWDDRTEFLASL